MRKAVFKPYQNQLHVNEQLQLSTPVQLDPDFLPRSKSTPHLIQPPSSAYGDDLPHEKVQLPIINYQIVPPVLNFKYGEKTKTERMKIDYARIKRQGGEPRKFETLKTSLVPRKLP